MNGAVSIRDSMAMIARFQAALIEHGISVGKWGPCEDGIDGRYGPDTQTGLRTFLQTKEDVDLPSTETLTALGVTEFDALLFASAVKAWNEWRNANASSPSYEEIANQILCESTGVCADSCGGAVPANGGGEGAGGTGGEGAMVPASTTGNGGVPWWFWLLVTGAVIGVGTFVGIMVARKKKQKRPGPAQVAPAYGLMRGPKIAQRELGGGGLGNYGEPEPEEDDDGGE